MIWTLLPCRWIAKNWIHNSKRKQNWKSHLREKGKENTFNSNCIFYAPYTVYELLWIYRSIQTTKSHHHPKIAYWKWVLLFEREMNNGNLDVYFWSNTWDLSYNPNQRTNQSTHDKCALSNTHENQHGTIHGLVPIFSSFPHYPESGCVCSMYITIWYFIEAHAHSFAELNVYLCE